MSQFFNNDDNIDAKTVAIPLVFSKNSWAKRKQRLYDTDLHLQKMDNVAFSK